MSSSEYLYKLSEEFWIHKMNAEREVASLVLSRPELLALAKRKGVSPLHFELEEYRIIFCCVDTMGDRLQSARLFLSWLASQFKYIERRPPYAIAWECGSWTNTSLARFADHPDASAFAQKYHANPTFEEWVDRLKDFHSRLTRAARLLQQARDVMAGEN